MNYLSVEQTLFIHMRLIVETGGGGGVRDLGLLASAVARPQATFDGNDLYPDLFSKAAALLDSLVRNHPFVDGNKRVGITAAGLFLQMNGRRLSASNAEIEAFTMQVARSELTVVQMSDWLRAHTMIP
ncbi:MAG: type II toxin-antitoxin system death-on-curing family toxin [Caldilineales bacterium]|nr:type II toxin-antitoxin system death-on-curing family toxin [Caldilineales bacterium]